MNAFPERVSVSVISGSVRQSFFIKGGCSWHCLLISSSPLTAVCLLSPTVMPGDDTSLTPCAIILQPVHGAFYVSLLTLQFIHLSTPLFVLTKSASSYFFFSLQLYKCLPSNKICDLWRLNKSDSFNESIKTIRQEKILYTTRLFIFLWKTSSSKQEWHLVEHVPLQRLNRHFITILSACIEIRYKPWGYAGKISIHL